MGITAITPAGTGGPIFPDSSNGLFVRTMTPNSRPKAWRPDLTRRSTTVLVTLPATLRDCYDEERPVSVRRNPNNNPRTVNHECCKKHDTVMPHPQLEAPLRACQSGRMA